MFGECTIQIFIDKEGIDPKSYTHVPGLARRKEGLANDDPV